MTTLSKSYYFIYISAISSALTGRQEDELCKVDCWCLKAAAMFDFKTLQWASRQKNNSFIPDKRPRKVRAGIDIAAPSPWQWLCSCVIVHCDGRAARWHWCRTSASGWETERPFRLSERKHSREKWQEASRAFWFRPRWHRHNSRNSQGRC